MCEFKVGDRVIMPKPRPECLIHKGVVGIILEMDEWDGPILKINTLEHWWTADQFELHFQPLNISLESK